MSCKNCGHWFVNPNIVVSGDRTEGKCLVSGIMAQSNQVCNAWVRSEAGNLMEGQLKANDRIAELEAERRWIPVSERLPEFGDVVLVCDSKGYVNKDFRYEADGKWKLTDFVRHWMPLPEPPEVQE